MKTCLTFILLSMSIFFSAVTAPAKTFYLNDGSSLEYEKVWKQGNRIFVMIYKDAILDFSGEEVDQRKTLKAAGLKKFPIVAVKKAKADPTAPHPSAPVDAPNREVDAVGETEKPLVFNDALSPLSVSYPSGKGRASSQSETGKVQGLSQELSTVYEGLHNAMKSKNVAGVKQYLSAGKASSMGAREQGLIEAGISLLPPNRTITGSSISPDGNSATLNLIAHVNQSDSKPGAAGTISFVREEGFWKLDQEHWDIKTD